MPCSQPFLVCPPGAALCPPACSWAAPLLCASALLCCLLAPAQPRSFLPAVEVWPGCSILLCFQTTVEEPVSGGVEEEVGWAGGEGLGGGRRGTPCSLVPLVPFATPDLASVLVSPLRLCAHCPHFPGQPLWVPEDPAGCVLRDIFPS